MTYRSTALFTAPRWSCFALSFVLLSCSKADDKKKEPLVDVPEPEAVAAQQTETKVQMRRHYQSIEDIQKFIVQGDLEAAKKEATDLKGRTAEIEGIQVAVKGLLESTDLASSARATATLASVCGGCHVASQSITSFEWVDAPADEDTPSSRMQRHLWAMTRLWEGLVAPSGMSWQAGAEVLAKAPFPADKLFVDGKVPPAAEKLLADLQAMGQDAMKAKDLVERTKVYGELLGACSACHMKTKEAGTETDKESETGAEKETETP
jgi:hypothetical protein